jgi:RP/EB family microtubule-associated protein
MGESRYGGLQSSWATDQNWRRKHRQELLAWLNGLLQLNVTKVEQCGTGWVWTPLLIRIFLKQPTDNDILRSAALCQIYDSIFLDLPMSRVKFNATTEYQYLENFKILSNTFRKHAVDRPLPTESLVKCKMQDNLEFLQWTKRYWDQYYPGGDYDAVGRRKGAAAAAPPSMGSARSSTATSGARRPVANATAPRTASRQAGAGGARW